MDGLEIAGGVIVFVTNVYLGVKANQIFQRTNEIMERQVALEHPGTTMMKTKPPPWRTYWPLVAMGLLTILTWSAVGYDIYDRHSQPVSAMPDWGGYKYKDVWNETYTDETVVVDGKSFHNCKFNNVSFEYDGLAPFLIDRIPALDVGATSRITTHNPIVMDCINLHIYTGRSPAGVENRPD
jgi:hypothetical protein